MTLASTIAVFLDSPPKYADEFSVVVAGTPNEASMISSSFTGSQVTNLTGSDADLSTLNDHVRGKKIVQFALDMPMSSNPLSSVVPIFSTKEEGGKKVTASRLFATNLPNDLVVGAEPRSTRKTYKVAPSTLQPAA